MPASLSKQYVAALFEIKLRVAVSLASRLHPSASVNRHTVRELTLPHRTRVQKHPSYSDEHVRG